MKKFALFIILLLTAGCAIQYNMHAANYSVTPARVNPAPIKAAIVVPEASTVKTIVRGEITNVIPEGQYIREMSRKYLSYAFQDILLINGKPYPSGIDAVFT